jgi:TolA-binding protein
MAEQLIFNTGLFHDDIKVWHATPADTRTWDLFQTFFHQAHQQYRCQKDTTQQAGYQAANAVFCMEMTEHIANLAHNDQTKDDILQKLTDQLTNMNKKMEEMEKKFDRPQQQHNVPTSNGTNTNTTAQRELAMSRMMKMLACPDSANYCSTHGYIIGDDHTSATCNKKGPGHIDDAT